MPRTAAIYCRISKDDDGERAGVERQEKDCRALAKRKGWRVAEVYVDNDLSAWNGRPRPEYERMLADVAAGRIDGVIVWHQDRLTRSPKELEHFFEVCDAARLRAMATYTGDIDLSTRDGQLQARIMGAVAKKSSDDTSARVRSAFDDKAARGEWKHGGVRPFGYEWSDKAGTIVPKADEARLVREAAKRVLAGESRRKITRNWHARGLRTQKGTAWSITRLAEVLRSPTVAGLRVHRSEVVGQGNWKPILDRDAWERVGRSMRRSGTHRPGRQRHVLTGLVVCGECKRPLSAKPRRRGGRIIRTYTCPSDRADRCGKVRILAEPLERVVLNTAWTHFEPEPILAKRADAETEAINDRLAELAEAEADLASARRGGALSSTVFLHELKLVNDERADLLRERGTREREAGGVVLTGAQLAQVEGPPATLTGAEPEAVEFWRSVVQAVFERVVVKPVGKGRWGRVVDRIELVPREGYEDAAIPLDPAEGYGLGA